MQTVSSRMGRVLKDLALACINATLLLILLCLLVWYLAAGRMEAAADSFARSAAGVATLREDVAALTGTLRDLRVAVADPAAAVTPQVQARLEGIQSRLDTLQDGLDGMAAAPSRLLDQSIETAGAELRAILLAVRGCHASDTPSRP